jgi:antitoxin VapB
MPASIPRSSSSNSPERRAAGPARTKRLPVRLFRNGANQAVRIPRELELPGNDATIRREGNKLIIEPAHRHPLLDKLARLKPLDIEWPDVDKGLLPLDDVKL